MIGTQQINSLALSQIRLGPLMNGLTPPFLCKREGPSQKL